MRHYISSVVDSTVSVVNPGAATVTSIAQGQTGYQQTLANVPYFNLKAANGFACVAAVTVDTNTAQTWLTAAVGTNTITMASGLFKTGLAVQLSTSGGLPTGLATSTTYFIVNLGGGVFAFATTYAFAIAATATSVAAGTNIKTFTSTGNSGTGTCTATALATCTVTPQYSLDGVTWVNFATATSITVTANFAFNQDRAWFPYFRLSYALASGSLTVANTYQAYGDGAGL